MKNYKYNVSKLPKPGITLIEASAGTGKTFSIIILYLRLLINLGLKKKYIRQLLSTDILLVTFTEASKNELKKRLYQGIIQLYQACITKKTKINYIKNILYDIENFTLTQKILKKTKDEIENIAIYTLHSFFWSILNEYKFFFPENIPEKIIQNMYPIQLQATQDFWRKNIYYFSEEITKIFIEKWPNPQKLFNYLYKWINNTCLNFSKKRIYKKDIEKKHEKLIQYINAIKKMWNQEKKKIKLIFQKLQINKRIYNQKNLKKWYEKIQLWTSKKTCNYKFPNILKYFNIKKINQECKEKYKIKKSFFNKIDQLYKKYTSLNQLYILFSLHGILTRIQKEKKKKNKIDFHDITKIFLKLTNFKNSRIKKLIKKKYPVTIIDEFQDIDSMQYEIFYQIYKKSKNESLILFGDPKQSIYSFRNANIFNYFKLKKKIKKHYFLKENFRSSHNMIIAINTLFQNVKKPFLFQELNFKPAKKHINNKKMNFYINNKKQPALKFYLYPKKTSTKENYYKWIAKKCAETISNWLSSKIKKKIKINLKNNISRFIKPNDIAVLVKNKYEAKFITHAFKKMALSAKYTSQKINIFNLMETKEIMWILDSILHPLNEKKLQKILLTHIFKKNIYEIYEINKKKEEYLILIKKIKNYLKIWQEYGIFNLLEEIIKDFNLIHCDILTSLNKINIKNIFSLREILIQKQKKITNKFLLILWLKKKILQSREQKNQNNNNNYFSENNSKKKIKIITVYKAKGLEYPVVWIPFFSNFYKNKEKIFYCRKTYKKILDLSNSKITQKLSEEERLSEDLRLLYVCITRSLLHCSIGVAPIKKKKNKNKENQDTNTHLSALGYLLQKGKKKNYQELKNILYSMEKKNVIEISKKNINSKKIQKDLIHKKDFQKNYNTRKIIYPWKIISFSQLNTYNKSYSIQYNKKFFDDILYQKQEKKKKKKLQGVEYGIFLHKILKKIDFSKNRDIEKKIKNFNYLSIPNYLIKKIKKSIEMMISVLLKDFNISLTQLKFKEYTKEMNFTIPIKKYINFKVMNYYIKKFDKISSLCPDISYDNISGILIGSIDLIFKWKNQFYFIDYKSNWLGSDNSAYTKKNIKLEIIKHRYDIQYQFYTLALHRYLKIHIKNYHYKKNFGGLFYIFLRALEEKGKNSGIFFKKIPYVLTNKLDLLFNGIIY